MKKTMIALFGLYVLQVQGQTVEKRAEIIRSYKPAKIEAVKKEMKQLAVGRQARVNAYLQEMGINHLRSVTGNSEEYLYDVVEGKPIFRTSYNSVSDQTISTDDLHTGGSMNLNLNGQNMVVGVWEVGGVANVTHEAMTGRITVIDGSNSSTDHASHVTGTIISDGTGLLNNRGRGLAYEATVDAADAVNDYTEMLDRATNDGLLVSNHSYGLRTDNLATSVFGAYGSDAREVDLLMNAAPMYLPVMSAGNSRNDGVNIAKGGYDLLTGDKTAKNSMIVAAVQRTPDYTGPASVVMSAFSSWGPPDDGRIKPDISAMGVGVRSCQDAASGYWFASGTSMSSPAIASMAILLQQHFNNVNGRFMTSAQLRGLINHTAREAGDFAGPDYEFGWGLANAADAAQVITNNGSTSFMEVSNYDETTRTFMVRADGTGPLKVSITWNDPAGSTINAQDIRSPRLVNNLDLKLTRNGTDFYPWMLNPVTPAAPATRTGANNLDNIEVVQIDNPAAGDVYEVTISHTGSIRDGSQSYALLTTGGVPTFLNTNEVSLDTTEVKIYPNPASDFIGIQTTDVEFSSVKITNVAGQVVFNVDDFDAELIDVSGLATGVYFVTLSNQKGQTKNIKFIKK